MCDPSTACDLDGRCIPLDDLEGKFFGYVIELERRDGEEGWLHGRPVGGATVAADSGEETAADENGYYEILLAPGEHVLTASAEGCQDGESTCTVGPGGSTECYLPVYTLGEEEGEDEIVVQGGCATGPGGSLPPGWMLAFVLVAGCRRRRSA
jgi:MYXO-CTERM domain-containing protein